VLLVAYITTMFSADIRYGLQQAKLLSETDELTGLFNMRGFAIAANRLFGQATRYGRPASVLMIDSDSLKAVNDKYGHDAGNRLLRAVANAMQAELRATDVPARYGDDEFIVLLEDLIGPQAVERAARRLGAQLAGAYIVDDRTLHTSVSMAAVIDATAYERPEDLLADVVVALAHAKTEGRGRFRLFDVTMRSSPAARVGLEADLARALERDELHLVFDPIVSLATGRLHGFEALLRWHHPARGVLQPLDFLPSAERTGAIVPIDRWVLQQACREARRWCNVPGRAPVRVTVNVSGKQLAERGFVTDVQDAVRDAGLAPGVLGVEIPVRVLTADLKSTTAILADLRRLKVQVHLDDFGTGWASLPRLPRLPLDWIKVDRSCVHRLGARRTDLDVVRSIVEQSKELGLGVIAEGVETGAQRARLMSFGCELGQGYRFAEPVSSSEVAGLLAEAARR
jgi:diguanylate cyclase (GGDEF)-like protein